MILTDKKFEAILIRLKEERTESPEIDGKADLCLQTEGDKAYFIFQAPGLKPSPLGEQL